ncbi:NAD(P)H-hydrate dehydratase [Streptomyces filamentosus]|uniref:NAD(P)H-hydrate dehydratase n=1 Tax=Streptomyces filamentosus TaxID=67294 RepID=UPI00167A3C8D|nr:NAD(P)H-hydrate dehydratase [Streptomyces filamentosus]
MERSCARELALRAVAVAGGGVKGDGGLVMVIGGSREYPGPPYVAALAARRAGAHGVRVAAPPAPAAQQVALEAHLIAGLGSELDAAAVAAAARVSRRMARRLIETGARGRVVWLVGPGLGGSPVAGRVLDALQEVRDHDRGAALVVDGSLGGGPRARERLRHLGADLVLLNRAEAHALLAGSGPVGRAGRGGAVDPAALAQSARETGAVMVAKGDPDLITDGTQTLLVPAGYPGLARHGSGDVLAGAAAALLAQTLAPAEAAALACHLVGTAGQVLDREVGPGWLTRELLDAVATALRDLLAAPARH